MHEIRREKPVEVGSEYPIFYRVLPPSQVVGLGISEPSPVGIGWKVPFQVAMVISRILRLGPIEYTPSFATVILGKGATPKVTTTTFLQFCSETRVQVDGASLTSR